MKLSEAIMLGSVSTGQAFGVLCDEKGNTCAMGAAYSAMGETLPHCSSVGLLEYVTYYLPMHQRMQNYWPHLEMIVWNPVTHLNTSLVECIVELNNVYRWTRPQIAAWVKTIESQLEHHDVVTDQSLQSLSN